MRPAQLLPLPLLLLLAIPYAAAQSVYTLEVELPTEWVNVGDGVGVALRVLDGANPVQGARIAITWSSPAAVVTNADGAAAYSFHRGLQAGVEQVSARVVTIATSEGPQSASSNTWTATLRFTAIDLRVEAPAGPHELGSSVPVTITATWRHDGAPAVGIRVRALNALPSAVLTDEAGVARFTATQAEEGTLVVDAGISAADRPHGIRGLSEGAVRLAFEDGDQDGDAAKDRVDNCPEVANPSQQDADEDGLGDVCDGDRDGDGAANGADANPDDPLLIRDADGDGADDAVDRCAGHPDSADADRDGVPDGCDPAPPASPPPAGSPPPPSDDADGDGVSNASDKCPTLRSSDQADLDGDGAGDACDADDDGDGIPDGKDIAPRDAATGWDGDADRVLDSEDNCPAIANADQADLDRDGAGDLCDNDRDGDGVSDTEDAFPANPAEARDGDGDGQGDAADPCPLDANRSAPCPAFTLPSATTSASQGTPSAAWLAPLALAAALLFSRYRT